MVLLALAAARRERDRRLRRKREIREPLDDDESDTTGCAEATPDLASRREASARAARARGGRRRGWCCMCVVATPDALSQFGGSTVVCPTPRPRRRRLGGFVFGLVRYFLVKTPRPMQGPH